MPLKLDFDEFEDEYPEIDDQRFYGFKQLSLSSNYRDDSFMRETVAYDVFEDMGVTTPATAFYEVYVDYGEGPVYFGLYTMIEVVDDTVIETNFEDDSGNVYKPDGIGSSFAAGSFNEDDFDKETNEDEADYSDILALYDVLHSDQRVTDPSTWRSDLEAVFDVDTFLRWLATNTVIQNWDTYGVAYHNYYLYTDPASGQITWIPWDNNESLKSSSGRSGVLSLSLDEVGDDWPLISYLIADEVYQAQYVAYVEQVAETAFNPATMETTYQELYDLILPYTVNESDGTDFRYSRFRPNRSYLRPLRGRAKLPGESGIDTHLTVFLSPPRLNRQGGVFLSGIRFHDLPIFSSQFLNTQHHWMRYPSWNSCRHGTQPTVFRLKSGSAPLPLRQS